ncbi:hypothetical protein PYCC9005_005962 [Savitreella phatthalungensis]
MAGDRRIDVIGGSGGDNASGRETLRLLPCRVTGTVECGGIASKLGERACEVGGEACTEAWLRGRHLHGKQMVIPEGYAVGVYAASTAHTTTATRHDRAGERGDGEGGDEDEGEDEGELVEVRRLTLRTRVSSIVQYGNSGMPLNPMDLESAVALASAVHGLDV